MPPPLSRRVPCESLSIDRFGLAPSSAVGGGTGGTAHAAAAATPLLAAAGGLGHDALSISLSLRALVSVYHVLFVISRQYSRHMSASH